MEYTSSLFEGFVSKLMTRYQRCLYFHCYTTFSSAPSPLPSQSLGAKLEGFPSHNCDCIFICSVRLTSLQKQGCILFLALLFHLLCHLHIVCVSVCVCALEVD